MAGGTPADAKTVTTVLFPQVKLKKHIDKTGWQLYTLSVKVIK